MLVYVVGEFVVEEVEVWFEYALCEDIGNEGADSDPFGGMT